MMHPIKVDISNQKIIIMNKTFAKRAMFPDTAEYKSLQQVRTDYEGFQVVTRSIKKNPNKESYNGLTYDYMRDYITYFEPKATRDKVLKELEEKIIVSKCHSRAFRYPVIKNWFLQKYPEIVEHGMPPKNNIQAANNIVASSTIEKKDCKDAAVASNPAA